MSEARKLLAGVVGARRGWEDELGETRVEQGSEVGQRRARGLAGSTGGGTE